MAGYGIRAVGMADTDPFLLRKETGLISHYLGNSHPAMANVTQTGREKAEYSPLCPTVF